MTDYTLHEHQELAVEHLNRQPRAGLFLPMGAGKSLTVLHSLTKDRLPALVVAPKRVAEHVWSSEPEKWRPDLSVGLAIGTSDKREQAIWSKPDLTVISRDNLSSLPTRRGRPRYRTVILDESQSFKSKSSIRWKTIRKWTKEAEFVWELTGTPAGNGLMDVWAPTYLLDNGKRLGETMTAFRQRYWRPKIVLPNGVVAKWELKRGAEEAIYKRLKDICLHIPLLGLDLPEQVINPVAVGLPDKALRFYEELKAEMIVDLDLIGGTGSMTVPSAGVLSSKLSQITAGGFYSEAVGDEPRGEYVGLHSEKLDQLAEIADQTEGGILVFYRFRFELEQILERFPRATWINSRGAIDAWNRGEIPMLIAHPASAGHGLNLQYGGSTIVWTSLSWSMEEWLQGNARLLRFGQKNVVMVHVLGVPGTIDDHVFNAVQGKVSIQDALLAAVS